MFEQFWNSAQPCFFLNLFADSEGEMVNNRIQYFSFFLIFSWFLSRVFLLCLSFFLQGLGSVSFQSFHQRTLSASSARTAQLTCYAAAFVIAILGIPPALVGAVAASTGGKRNGRPLWPGAICIVWPKYLFFSHVVIRQRKHS